MESRYYALLNEILDVNYENGIHGLTADDNDRLYGVLEEELKSENGSWHAWHFNSTAEFMLESILEDEELPLPVEEMIGDAIREIGILERTGHEHVAKRHQEMLDEVLEHFAK